MIATATNSATCGICRRTTAPITVAVAGSNASISANVDRFSRAIAS
ncbi:MAG TPA: hypothetical protein VFH76_30355 [Kribbella sp.]|nr:hypothetical protein [Kribbella sp.]